MELKVPVTQPGQTDWVDVRIDRNDLGDGLVEKTITVGGNPLETLLIQPWLEEKALINSPDEGGAEAPTGHLSYTFDNTAEAQVTIRVQE
jgi:hypothetical protein